MRPVLAGLLAFIIAALLPIPGVAQPTPEQLTLRPGDKIIWIDASGGHLVMFGGLANLRPLADIEKVLTFDPPLSISDQTGVSQQGGDPMLTATVKLDAAQSGVADINFTCAAHPGSMRSRPFTIAPTNGQPLRELKIHARSNPNNWELETSSGGVIIDAALFDPSNPVAQPQKSAHRH